MSMSMANRPFRTCSRNYYREITFLLGIMGIFCKKIKQTSKN